jgi:hypothetical protein
MKKWISVRTKAEPLAAVDALVRLAILRASLTRTKLKTAKVQVDVMVVDHVEKPSPN